MCCEANKALVRRYFEEVWNKGRLEVLDEIISPAFSGCGASLSGPEALKLYISAYRATFPNTRFSLLGLSTIDEDKVSACWASRGTYAGWCSVAHHGRTEAPATGLSIYRIADGKIMEAWATSDELGPMQPIGVISQ